MEQAPTAGVAEIFSVMAQVLRRDGLVLMALVLLFSLPLFAADLAHLVKPEAFGQSGSTVLSALLWPWLLGALARAVDDSLSGRKPGLPECVRHGKDKWGVVFFLRIYVAAGFVLLGAPGAALALGAFDSSWRWEGVGLLVAGLFAGSALFSFALPAAVLDRVAPYEALRRSVRSSWRHRLVLLQGVGGIATVTATAAALTYVLIAWVTAPYLTGPSLEPSMVPPLLDLFWSFGCMGLWTILCVTLEVVAFRELLRPRHVDVSTIVETLS